MNRYYPTRRYWTAEEEQTLRELHNQGCDTRTIAERMGITPQRVTSKLYKIAHDAAAPKEKPRKGTETMPVPYPFPGWDAGLSHQGRYTLKKYAQRHYGHTHIHP